MSHKCMSIHEICESSHELKPFIAEDAVCIPQYWIGLSPIFTWICLCAQSCWAGSFLV